MPASINFAHGMLKLLPDANPASTKFRFNGFLKRAQDVAGRCPP
jgi:hypothetical protein